MEYDVVVVGARCAGASTAMLLARQGRSVLLVDKASFPSDTMSTLYIHQPGVAKLSQWGLLDSIAASGCPALNTVSHEIGDLHLAAEAPIMGNVTAGYAPRRYILDNLLIQSAITAGADFAENAYVDELIWHGQRVVGILMRSGNTLHRVSANLVIGADGMRSKVAKLVNAPLLRSDPRATCVYYTFWQGLVTGFGFHEGVGRWIARIPTHDNLTIVATYLPQDEFAEARRNPVEAYMSAVKMTAPKLFDQMKSAEQVERLRGTGDQRNYFRQSYGAGWALVGDSAHHLDTISARGITNALIQADTLSQAVSSTELGDAAAVDDVLCRVSKELEAELHETYLSTLELARLSPTSARVQLLRAVEKSPELTKRYFALVAGIINMREFITADMVDML